MLACSHTIHTKQRMQGCRSEPCTASRGCEGSGLIPWGPERAPRTWKRGQEKDKKGMKVEKEELDAKTTTLVSKETRALSFAK